MELKFKQGVYVADLDLVVNVGDVYPILDKAQALDLIAAGFADEVVKEKPVKKATKKVADAE